MGVIRVSRDSDYPKILNEVICRYESNVGVKTFDPDVLVKDPASDIWFTTRCDDKRLYFERYRRYLRQSGWDNDVIDNLETNCEKPYHAAPILMFLLILRSAGWLWAMFRQEKLPTTSV